MGWAIQQYALAEARIQPNLIRRFQSRLDTFVAGTETKYRLST